VLPLSPGRAERHGFEYYRHGTLSLFAALDTRSGEVLALTVPRHASAAFVDFPSDIVTSQPKGREIDVIVDNLATPQDPGGAHVLDRAPQRAAALHVTGAAAGSVAEDELGLARSGHRPDAPAIGPDQALGP
jgi:hypothetical protein